MSEKTVRTKAEGISARARLIVEELTNKSVKIRVAPNNYFVALFLATFLTGFLIYLQYDVAAIILFVTSWIGIPVSILTDKITFDGHRIVRTGLFPRIWAKINNSTYDLDLAEIEQVETQALRAIKRGGSVFYRYRTSVRGSDIQFVLASGGDDYRRMVQKFFPLISENVLDNRSIELRDYINEPTETMMKAQSAKIPPVDVLETSVNEFNSDDRNLKFRRGEHTVGDKELEKADNLRTIANELRLSGNLLQALEAFRRALSINPKSGWLLFEFARCLHSFAGAEKNPRLERKALAALRLAEKRAEDDQELLS